MSQSVSLSKFKSNISPSISPHLNLIFCFIILCRFTSMQACKTTVIPICNYCKIIKSNPQQKSSNNKKNPPQIQGTKLGAWHLQLAASKSTSHASAAPLRLGSSARWERNTAAAALVKWSSTPNMAWSRKPKQP